VFGRASSQDSEIEQEVVDSVGSYGYQLNRILDALVVLVCEADLDESSVGEDDLRALYRLPDLADAADEGARRAKVTKTARWGQAGGRSQLALTSAVTRGSWAVQLKIRLADRPIPKRESTTSGVRTRGRGGESRGARRFFRAFSSSGG
jgi:hypothetical protein